MKVIFLNPKIQNSLYSLEKSISTKSYKQIKLLQTFGNKLGMPYSKQISKNLFELRVRGKQEIRIFYCFYQNQAVIIHYFIKKSQKTPLKEIETALNRIAMLTNI